MNEDAEMIESYISDLATIANQQAKAMALMADQMRALFALNLAFIGVLCNQSDRDLVRTAALKAFGDNDRDTNSIALIDSMLSPAGLENASSLEKAMPDLLRNVERARFTIIRGGRHSDG